MHFVLNPLDLCFRKGKTCSQAQGIEQEQKKPRRKDTPVLYIPPLTPGNFILILWCVSQVISLPTTTNWCLIACSLLCHTVHRIHICDSGRKKIKDKDKVPQSGRILFHNIIVKLPDKFHSTDNVMDMFVGLQRTQKNMRGLRLAIEWSPWCLALSQST
uniref:Uncharacterized protein n=1 Tax=Erpetoichthys calabaricus TaxID=27687 RepID=A0A8C4RVG2_ERPCA